jgi:hypothetical protein
MTRDGAILSSSAICWMSALTRPLSERNWFAVKPTSRISTSTGCCGSVVGAKVGAAVGPLVGAAVGTAVVGAVVGAAVVGAREGAAVVGAAVVGAAEGAPNTVGASVGAIVGPAVGCSDGRAEGVTEGASVGFALGRGADGAPVGCALGAAIGLSVGAADGELVGEGTGPTLTDTSTSLDWVVGPSAAPRVMAAWKLTTYAPVGRTAVKLPTRSASARVVGASLRLKRMAGVDTAATVSSAMPKTTLAWRTVTTTAIVIGAPESTRARTCDTEQRRTVRYAHRQPSAYACRSGRLYQIRAPGDFDGERQSLQDACRDVAPRVRRRLLTRLKSCGTSCKNNNFRRITRRAPCQVLALEAIVRFSRMKLPQQGYVLTNAATHRSSATVRQRHSHQPPSWKPDPPEDDEGAVGKTEGASVGEAGGTLVWAVLARKLASTSVACVTPPSAAPRTMLAWNDTT